MEQYDEVPSVSVSIPFSKDTEEAIIGTAIINPEILNETTLEAQDFYILRHVYIWTALLDLKNKKMGIDYITLLDELEDKGKLELVGGSVYVASLINQAGLSSNIASYEKIVKAYAKRRALVAVAQDIAKVAYGEEADSIDAHLGEIVARLLKNSLPKKGLQPLSVALGKLADEVSERAKNPTDIWGIPTGFPDLDAYMGGLQKGEIFYLAGEPASGKTKLAVQIAINAASDRCGGHMVGIYSLEMQDIAVARRMVAAVSNVSTRSMRSGKMSDEDWTNFFNGVGTLEEGNIYLSDDAFITTTELRSDIARMKANYGVELVVLDYLLLVSGYEKIDNETERSAKLSRDIKGIAKDMNVAMIVVNSVTKEGMDGGMALKKNLRGSGQLIHDADVVAMLQAENCPPGAVMKPVSLVFTKVRDVEKGTTTIRLLADPQRPIFHSAERKYP